MYIPIPNLLTIKNGAYFPVMLENPAVLEAQKRKEEIERKKAAGLLLEDGSESPEQKNFRTHLKAKMNWRGAGNKVKLAVALSSEVSKPRNYVMARFLRN